MEANDFVQKYVKPLQAKLAALPEHAKNHVGNATWMKLMFLKEGCTTLLGSKLESTPDSLLQEAGTNFTNLQGVLRPLEGTLQLNQQQKDGIEKATASTMQSAVLVILYSEYTQLEDIKFQTREIADHRDELSSAVQEARTSIEQSNALAATTTKLNEESISKLEILREKVGEIGASHHSIRFGEEATSRLNESYIWLAALILLIIGLGCYALSTEGEIAALTAKKVLNLWPHLAVRATLLSLGSVALFVCIRNYSACRHNFTVARHRQNALSTFQYFVEAATESDTKSAVLLEATKAVFSHTSSGYLKAADEGTPQPQIIELIRNLK